MKQATGQQNKATVGTTSTLLVPASPKRKALLICRPPTNEITLSLGNAAVANEGVILDTTDPPLLLTAALHGGMVRGPIYAISDTSAQTITFWESMADED